MKEREQWKCLTEVPENVKKIQYKGCGLDDVYLVGGYEIINTHYGEGVSIRDMDGLHRAIGEHLATQKKELSGKELRFLRKEMDLTQSELGRFIGLSSQQVARWEKAQQPISGPADFLLRKLYLEHINGKASLKELVEELDSTDVTASDEQVFTESNGQWRAVA
jgi:putative transcriptional regulator